MTVFQNHFRDGRWRYDFRDSGKRYQGYCYGATTREEALACEDAARLRVGKMKSEAAEKQRRDRVAEALKAAHIVE